jgi:hypothetical protein
MSAEGTNNGATEEKFERTYTEYNPAPAQGPPTEVLGTVIPVPSTP